MKDRNYSKQEIALYQLEKAIDLFLEGDDYISCITLAGAAEEIYGKIITNNDDKHILDLLKEYYKDDPSIDTSNGFFRWARSTRNALKHFNDLEEQEVYVCKLEAQMYIQSAIINHLKAEAIYTCLASITLSGLTTIILAG